MNRIQYSEHSILRNLVLIILGLVALVLLMPERSEARVIVKTRGHRVRVVRVSPRPAVRVVLAPAPVVRVKVVRPPVEKDVWVPGHYRKLRGRRMVWVPGHWKTI